MRTWPPQLESSVQNRVEIAAMLRISGGSSRDVEGSANVIWNVAVEEVRGRCSESRSIA